MLAGRSAHTFGEWIKTAKLFNTAKRGRFNNSRCGRGEKKNVRGGGGATGGDKLSRVRPSVRPSVRSSLAAFHSIPCSRSRDMSARPHSGDYSDKASEGVEY